MQIAEMYERQALSQSNSKKKKGDDADDGFWQKGTIELGYILRIIRKKKTLVFFFDPETGFENWGEAKVDEHECLRTLRQRTRLYEKLGELKLN